VLDTDVASRIFKHDVPGPVAVRLADRPLCITFVTLAELTQWATLREWGPRRRTTLTRWIDDLIVLPGSDDVARRWGEISAGSRRRGRPRPQNDMWIAACCLAYNLPLATLNGSDFEEFARHDGLELVLAP
jgi:predicted nucleic acid-binding protein